MSLMLFVVNLLQPSASGVSSVCFLPPHERLPANAGYLPFWVRAYDHVSVKHCLPNFSVSLLDKVLYLVNKGNEVISHLSYSLS